MPSQALHSSFVIDVVVVRQISSHPLYHCLALSQIFLSHQPAQEPSLWYAASTAAQDMHCCSRHPSIYIKALSCVKVEPKDQKERAKSDGRTCKRHHSPACDHHRCMHDCLFPGGRSHLHHHHVAAPAQGQFPSMSFEQLYVKCLGLGCPCQINSTIGLPPGRIHS